MTRKRAPYASPFNQFSSGTVVHPPPLLQPLHPIVSLLVSPGGGPGYGGHADPPGCVVGALEEQVCALVVPPGMKQISQMAVAAQPGQPILPVEVAVLVVAQLVTWPAANQQDLSVNGQCSWPGTAWDGPKVILPCLQQPGLREWYRSA